MIEAYPLTWPEGWPRTPRHRVSYSPFKAAGKSQEHYQNELMEEIRRMGGGGIIISTNIELRKDGMPYANRRQPDDKGVAVYFTRKGRPHAFACDAWSSVGENMRGITKTIDALRGIERWGSGEMMERTFTGFAALPSPTPSTAWWIVLEVSRAADIEECELRYKRLSKLAHPDMGGSEKAMSELNVARDQMRAEKGAA